MDAQEQIRRLVEEIHRSHPRAATELNCFDSGAAMLDVRIAGKVLVMAYSPKSGFGVDQLAEDEGFDTGYRFISHDFENAAAELRRLIEGAGGG